jgi:hypothetical protein
MTRYERLWMMTTGITCAAGSMAALRGWSWVPLLGTFLTAGVMGAVLVLPLVIERDQWIVVTLGAVPICGTATVIVMGLVRIGGVAGLVAASVLAVAAPASLAFYVAVGARIGLLRAFPPDVRAGDPVTPAPGAPTGASAVDALGEDSLDVPDVMSDIDLCAAWRSSFVALQRAETVGARAGVVTMRALYLEELERRSGEAVRAWLRSGARAASDPGRYLRRSDVRPEPPAGAESGR